MRVLITGGQGQLAQALLNSAPSTITATALSRQQLDITDSNSIEQALQHYQPQLVINCAAYTAVDKAEINQEQASLVNAHGAANIARLCHQRQIKLIHISTDYVVADNHYGISKLAGEQVVMKLMPSNALIVRTSGLYSTMAGNFVTTMLLLMQQGKPILVVEDQITVPTSCFELANCLWQLVDQLKCSSQTEIYNCVARGQCSWYEFAVEIQQLALAHGLLQKPVNIMPISSSEYAAQHRRVIAKRPAYSVLDNKPLERLLDQPFLSWQEQLSRVIQQIAADKIRH